MVSCNPTVTDNLMAVDELLEEVVKSVEFDSVSKMTAASKGTDGRRAAAVLSPVDEGTKVDE